MATSLTALTVRFGADSSAVTKAAKNMTATMRGVNQLLRQAETPQERLAKSASRLKAALDAGRISAEQYEKGMRHLEAGNRRGASSFQSLAGSILPVITVMGALRSAIRRIGEADELIKSARAAGETASRFMQLTFAMQEVGGLSAQQAQDVLKKFNLTIGEAAQKGGKAADALETLGLKTNAFLALSPADRFQAVVEALQGVESATKRSTLATDLFGRQTRDVMAILNSQEGALRDSEQAAKDLGIALTEEQEAAIESVSDSLRRMGDMWRTTMARMVATLQPVIKATETIVGWISKWIAGLSEKTQRTLVFSAAIAGLVIVIKSVVSAIIMVVGALKLQAKAQAIVLALQGPKGWAILAGAAIAAAGAIYGVNKALEETVEKAKETSEAAAGVAEEFAKLDDLPIPELYKEQEDAHVKAWERQQKISEEYEKQLETLKLQQMEAKGLHDEAEKLRLASRGFNEEQIKRIKAEQQQLDLLKKQQAERDRIASQAERALELARREFEQQIEARRQMRQDVAAGPSGMQAGSGEAARFLAEQANRAIAAAAVPPKPTPGERQLIDESKKQLVMLERQRQTQDQLLVAFRQQIAAYEKSRVQRIR